MINTYEIILTCLLGDVVQPLGTVQAKDPFQAKDYATSIWPYAREEGMLIRFVECLTEYEPDTKRVCEER